MYFSQMSPGPSAWPSASMTWYARPMAILLAVGDRGLLGTDSSTLDEPVQLHQSSSRYRRTQRSGSVPPSFFTLKRSLPSGPGNDVARHNEGLCANCWRTL